jgi:hypothetical protein
MRRLPLLAATLLLAATPVAAQEYLWNADRPDGVAPVGIVVDRPLDAGALRVGYRFSRAEWRGLRSTGGILLETDALDLGFTFVPLEMTATAHRLTLGYGITDDLTVMATGGYLMKDAQFANDSVFFFGDSEGIMDAEADVLWEVYSAGPYKGHLQLGVIAPFGSIDQTSDFPTAADAQLPYDMQIGTGSWLVMPGVGAQVMNETGSVGGQIRGVFALTDNDRGWRPGDRLEGLVWMAHRFNRNVSASTGVRGYAANDIQGIDPDLETLRLPGDLALTYGGNRVDIPLGVNLRMTEGPLAGHRVGVEAVWTVHEKVHGPRIGSDWAVNIGWQTDFRLPSLSLF